MNLLQRLVQNIQQAGVNAHTAVGNLVDPMHTIQPGQKLSPAVQAQNRAPIQTTYNAKGQPTQEVFANGQPTYAKPGEMAPYFPESQTYGIQPPQQSFLQQVSAMHRGFTPNQATSVAQAPVPYADVSPSIQGGNFNPGYIPMQPLGPTPQAGAFNNPQQRNANSQNPYQMY